MQFIATWPQSVCYANVMSWRARLPQRLGRAWGWIGGNKQAEVGKVVQFLVTSSSLAPSMWRTLQEVQRSGKRPRVLALLLSVQISLTQGEIPG